MKFIDHFMVLIGIKIKCLLFGNIEIFPNLFNEQASRLICYPKIINRK